MSPQLRSSLGSVYPVYSQEVWQQSPLNSRPPIETIFFPFILIPSAQPAHPYSEHNERPVTSVRPLLQLREIFSSVGSWSINCWTRTPSIVALL